ncbi:MAG: dihydrodipicolinate synthase family protein, partial [Deltaproteobacteria bacterium]|nr:dihydrodipicolinate synthase family protein [Deltaproteobacteria bacterium]
TIVPLVTPFSFDESFDRNRMSLLIDFILEQGADALMATALTGEGSLLTSEETLVVWDSVFEKAEKRIPVVPAIIATTTRQAVFLAKAAEARGAGALMAVPILPELYAGRSYDEVYSFYADLAAATSLPIILFNYPSLSGVDFVPVLVERLLKIPTVRYIKESTGDTRRVHGLQRAFGDRISVICGAPNVALESLALGCRVWITGTMNIVPKSARQLFRAMLMNDLPLARRIYYRQILPFVEVMARNFNPTGTIKAGVAARGVEVGLPRKPGGGVSPNDRAHLERLAAEVIQAEDEIENILTGRSARSG